MLDISEGIKYFNKGDFYEAHEAWEAVWRPMPDSPAKRFVQGLIMIAAAFHHYLRGEYNGTGKLITRGMALLEMNRHVEAGIDLDSFLKETRAFHDKFRLSTRKISEERLAFPKIKKTQYA
jgi:hypothetical protein